MAIRISMEEEGDGSKNKNNTCSKRIVLIFISLVVSIGGGYLTIGGKQEPPSPKPVLKLNANYPVSKDVRVEAKPKVIAKAPTKAPSSAPPSAKPHQEEPPMPPKPFLELNADNPISKDVSRLWQNEMMGAVCISIPRNADCSHPLLIGRLSGPSLSILEWTNEATSDDSTTFCGKYRGVIQGAMYFVEILTAYCEDFSVGALSGDSSSTSPRHTDEWLSFNWTEVCMQNTLTNRLTQENCAILISSPTLSAELENALNGTQSEESQAPGYWTRNEEQNLIPLYTRFQPLDCQGNNKRLPRCMKPMSTARFDGYDFAWTSRTLQEWKAKDIPNSLQGNNTDLLRRCNCQPDKKDCWDGMCRVKCVNCMQENTMPTSPMENGKKVCVVGASHSYHLMYSIENLQMSHLFHWIMMQYPLELEEGFFEEQYKMLGCNIFVLGFGQWPASHQTKPPYSFERYLAEMTRIAQLAEDSFGPFQVYLRSMHHMPIGDRASTCPPIDWRSPAVGNGYNYLLEQAILAVNKSSPSPKVHFLDTLFITHPMWDVAYDLYHLPRKVSDLEAIYIASVVL
ncbi:unnamed protein product [Cylindrotheca closterium]|uniref:Uncharacterized protein n=1 Tax=Cylindrotheca closterium TaxID=2856 RepID=A0AAD2G737_9STRA|nr:unnamed protein product [Cylindrotheca closterium]